MLNLSKDVLLDRMLAAWMGKNIGGTLGGPLEGIMELLDIRFYTQQFDGPMPNDDLDLQLLNLHCLEQYGPRLTTDHLASAWAQHNFFPYDEYGHALTNHRRGLKSPLAGHYNNLFIDCMGSPIRSEIWAMVAAGNPDLAAHFAQIDANIDHAGGEGVYGEIFFAVLESLAFELGDKQSLISQALAYIPEQSVTAQAIRETVRLFDASSSWQSTRQRLIDLYAGPNFTYAPLNVAFTILAFLYGRDFEDAILIACNCGYDTDCTVATVGSILGIIGGMAVIPDRWIEPIGYEIKVSAAVNGFDAPKDLHELTERSYRMQQLVAAEWTNGRDRSAYDLDYDYLKQSWTVPQGCFMNPSLRVDLRAEDDHPVFTKAEKLLRFTIENKLTVAYQGRLSLELPAPLSCEGPLELNLAPGERSVFHFRVLREDHSDHLCDCSCDDSHASRFDYQYDCALRIDRYQLGHRWLSEWVPFVLMPAHEWRITTAAETYKLSCPTAVLEVPASEYQADSTLYMEEDCEVDIIVATEAAARLLVDGTELFSCEEHTDFIPAYHRSDRRKRGSVVLKAGAHKLQLNLRSQDGECTKAAVYVVSRDPERLFMHELDYRLFAD